MQKWDYLIVQYSYDDLKNKIISIQISNGSTFSRVKFSALIDTLNQLGKEGWEIITSEQGIYHLKRPVE